MKDLIIVGAGGFGRDLFFIITESEGYNVDFRVLGYIDDNPNALANYSEYPDLIGDISNHSVKENQVFICSISKTDVKMRIVSSLISKGASFINIIHNTARVTKTSTLGKGVIIGPFVSVGADSIIGDSCILQTGTIVGHDVSIGNNSRIDNYSILVAGAQVEENCTIHSSSVINSNIKIGEGATVGACSFVIRNVKANSSVFGNPAKILF